MLYKYIKRYLFYSHNDIIWKLGCGSFRRCFIYKNDEARLDDDKKSLIKILNDINGKLKTNDKDPNLHNQIATIYIKLKQYSKAIKSINEAIKLDPTNPEYLNYKGNALLYKNRFNEALIYFNQAINIKPTEPAYQINKASALYSLQKYSQALTLYDTLLILNSNDIESLIGKGDTLFMMNRYQEALTIYEQVLLVDNDNMDVIKLVGLLQKHLTNPKNRSNKFSLFKLRVVKKDVLTKSLKKIQIIFAIFLLSVICYITYSVYNESDNIGALVRSVEVSRLLNKFDEALTRTDEIIVSFPNSDVGYKLKVDILFELERYEEANIYIDKLMTDNQNDLGLYMLKGISLGESDQKPKAVEYLNIYLSTYPDDDFIIMYRDKLQKSIDNKSGS